MKIDQKLMRPLSILALLLSVFFLLSMPLARLAGSAFWSRMLRFFQMQSPLPGGSGSMAPQSGDARSGIPQGGNPFGVMLGSQISDLATRMQTAKNLGAVYYRPLSVFIDTWNGRCAECDAARAAGLKLILTVRNNGGPQHPTTPPTDVNHYATVIGQILDTYHPILLVVENEENSKIFYSGTPSDYHRELRAACSVAHTKGVACANGGLVSSEVVVLMANDLYHQGNTTKAVTLLQEGLGKKLQEQLGKIGDVSRVFGMAKFQQLVRKGNELVSGYNADGADYMNFHWYIADTQMLTDAVNFLRSASGLPVITNEWGQQQNENADQIGAVMQQMVNLKLPIAVEFSIDIAVGEQARALVNTDGSLRPNGVAFKDFIRKTY